eukprot:14329900-Alexandrium_andersonii.AAC.1
MYGHTCAVTLGSQKRLPLAERKARFESAVARADGVGTDDAESRETRRQRRCYGEGRESRGS